MDGNREALGTKLLCFGRAVENGGTFYTFYEEELHEIVPKTMARTARKQLDR